MKKILPVIGLGLLTANLSYAQNTFSDDFESYTVGGFLGTQSPQFTTWSNQPGGTEDVTVVNTDAYSGTKSIYLASTATNGGPTDVLLPFGNTIKTGHFTLGAAFKVQSGKKGYFNLQKTATAGTAWTMDVTFEGGVVKFENVGTLLYSVAYPENTWFEWRLEINANNSRYDVYINNDYEGSFHNPEAQFASMNIFAMSGSAFWVDDVHYEYTPFVGTNVEAAVSYVNGLTGGLVGQEKIPVATVRNLGTSALTSFDLNVDYNGSSYSQSFTSMNIAANASQNIAILPGIQLVVGPSPIRVYISNVNMGLDATHDDDTVALMLNPITPAAGRVVIAEEGTGTWCGWCPRGAVMMEHMEDTYPDHFQGIAVHNGDPMTVAAYDDGLGLSSFPGAKVDRLSVIDPSGIETAFIPQVQVAPSAFITPGAVWNSATRELQVSLSYDFQTTITGNWKAALVITENEVTGTGSGWAQSNYYAGGSEGPMGGYESLPNPVPAAQMVYNDVARLITPSFGGLANAFPSPTNTGDVHTLNYTFTVPASWDENNLHIIGLLIKANGRIDNAGVATIEEAETNGFVSGSAINAGIEEVGAPDVAFSVYPNPTRGEALVKVEIDGSSELVMSIRDINGKEIMSRNYGVMNGAQILPINTDGMTAGIYMIELQMNGKRYCQKLVKQ